MKQILITLLFFFTGFTVLAQVGIGTQTPQATLDITGNQGLLIPRMSDHTVLIPIDGTLDSNEQGLQVYNTSTNTIMLWDGSLWKQIDQVNVVSLWKSMANAGVYNTSDIINHNGVLYKNLTGVNTNTTPDSDTTNWGGVFGSSGPRGHSILQGSGAPTSVSGIVNDLYLDTDTTELYEKTSATNWTLQHKLIEMQYVVGRQYNVGDIIINTNVNGVMTQYAVVSAFTATNFASDLSNLHQTNRFSMTAEIYTAGNSYTTGQWVVNGSSIYYANKNITSSPVTLNTADFNLLNSATPSILTLTDTDLTSNPPVLGDLLMYDGVNWVPMPEQQFPTLNTEGLAGGVFKGKPIYKMTKYFSTLRWSSSPHGAVNLTPTGTTEIVDYKAYLDISGSTYDLKERSLTNNRYFRYSGPGNSSGSRKQLWYVPSNSNNGWDAWKTGNVIIYFIK
jgi:hypothetical protein